jgi:hypothetical protein
MAMDRVEQYHTHTRMVDGYKILPVPISIPDGYPYPLCTQRIYLFLTDKI